MKSREEIEKVLEGLRAAYDMASTQEWYKKINDYIDALKWVIGD